MMLRLTCGPELQKSWPGWSYACSPFVLPHLKLSFSSLLLVGIDFDLVLSHAYGYHGSVSPLAYL